MTDVTRSPLVAVIILNWNNVVDTIECLKSLGDSSHRNLLPIIVDNDSTDDSLEKLHAWRSTSPMSGLAAARGEELASDYQWTERHGLRPKALPGADHNSFIIVENEQNLGFAAGCNVGIRLALALNAEYLWLLNNDTEADRRCLEQQLRLLQAEPSIDCVVPVILVQGSGDKVWNCGGRLWPGGLRRYLYAGASRDSLPQSGHRRVSFVTGCSLLLRRSTVLSAGMLSEDFFFGEEDLEFSLRLHKLGKAAACCFDAILMHRVSGTFAGPALNSRLLGRVYLYYLNRFVHYRRYLPGPIWRLWRAIYMIYVVALLLGRHTRSLTVVRNVVSRLNQESARLHGVSRETFFEAMRHDFSVAEPGPAEHRRG
jgi:GT2 family glycosyltransferase